MVWGIFCFDIGEVYSEVKIQHLIWARATLTGGTLHSS